MIHMVKLQSKSGTKESADITVIKLIDLLAGRGMPPVEILKFDKRLQENLHIDGATVYKEFADIIFSPYTITDEEADRRLIKRK